MVAALLKFVKVFGIGLLAGLSAGVFGTSVLVGLIWFATRPDPIPQRHLPDGPTLVEKIREVARLEALEVSTYKKLGYEVPPPESDSMIGSLATWARYSTNPPAGRAIVFADVHIGLDLSKIDETAIQIEPDAERITLVLPPLVTRVELKPGETEVIASNLNTAGTAELFDRAKWAIEADVRKDEMLKGRARDSAQRALATFLQSVGFREVVFVDALAPAVTATPAPAS